MKTIKLIDLLNKIANGEKVHKDFAELSERYFFTKSRNEKAREYCRLNKEFTPRLEDVENILNGGQDE